MIDLSDTSINYRLALLQYLIDCGKLLGNGEREQADFLVNPLWQECFESHLSPSAAISEFKSWISNGK